MILRISEFHSYLILNYNCREDRNNRISYFLRTERGRESKKDDEVGVIILLYTYINN